MVRASILLLVGLVVFGWVFGFLIAITEPVLKLVPGLSGLLITVGVIVSLSITPSVTRFIAGVFVPRRR